MKTKKTYRDARGAAAPDRVLIVDDQEAYLNECAMKYDPWLGKLGYQVEIRPSASSAIAYLKKKHKIVEMIMVDIVLPLSQSIKLLTFAKKNFPGIKRVALTGQAKPEAVGKLASLELIEGYFEKNWKPARIQKEIKRVLIKPCDDSIREGISSALNHWLMQDPKAKNTKIQYLDGGEVSLADIAKEIEKGTEFGKRQERVIYRLACDLFTMRSSQAKGNGTSRGVR